MNEKAGLSFASALRSILRQDPDVVLIGEIRDRETAAIAMQASLTGHLVFSTLHTNDAAAPSRDSPTSASTAQARRGAQGSGRAASDPAAVPDVPDRRERRSRLYS